MDIDDLVYREVLEGLYDGVYFVDRDRVIRYWNRAAERLTGYTREQVLGTRCADGILCHTDDQGRALCGRRCPLLGVLKDERPREASIFLRHREGHRVPIQVRASPLRNRLGEVQGVVEVFSENTWRHEAQTRLQELERLALLDSLTQVPNRRYIDHHLNVRFQEHERYGRLFGVLLLDVDHFKRFNDEHGHILGDRVLVMVSQTLLQGVRASDLIGRWGGEEFLAIIASCDEQNLAIAAERLRGLVAASEFEAEGKRLGVTISVGGAAVRQGETPEALVKRADERLYEAKKAGRNRVVVDTE